jgi:RNA polymerase sigma-70 factor (ECF subfamily)
VDHASNWTPESLLRHEEFVLRLARTLVRAESDAEEVAQRTFASAVENPPKHGALRAWLTRVVRNHATDLHRKDRRRSDRERAVARKEAVDSGASAMELLELEHGVVRAVLALDEPYRGAVVQTYYEGLTPSEIAARNGVPAGTVRSQLSRAHEMLRGKLDHEHGGRGPWMSALTGLMSPRDLPAAPLMPPAGASSSAAASVAWPIAIGAGLAACIAAVFVVQANRASDAASTETAQIESVSIDPTTTTLPPVGAVLTPVAFTHSREAIEDPTPESIELDEGFVPADDPAQLLVQSRQIKTLVLDRKLKVTPEERERAGIPVDTETTGVAHLLDRTVFGDKFTLPWMRGGGAYYSFSERVNDYNRKPQISLEGGRLNSGFHGQSSSIILDLGERHLSDVSASGTAPSGLEPAERFVWDVAKSNLEETDSDLHQFTSARVHDALEQRGLTEQAALAVERIVSGSVDARVGHSYLMRSISGGAFDVLVAFEVLALTDEGCTIAWRLDASRPVDVQDEIWVVEDEPSDVPPPPPELAAMNVDELVLALGAVRSRVDEVLFLHFAPEVEHRFGSWRGPADSGLVRLTPHQSKWTEFGSRPLGGAMYSFAQRSHDANHYDIDFEAEGFDRLHTAFAGRDCGAIVDLGAVPVESTNLGTIEALAGSLGRLLTQHEFPVREVDTDPRTRTPEAWETLSASERADSAAFVQARNELEGSDSAAVSVGHTYAVRSVVFGAHDVLAAVHVAAQDDQGVVIAWKLLKTWPVTPRD